MLYAALLRDADGGGCQAQQLLLRIAGVATGRRYTRALPVKSAARVLRKARRQDMREQEALWRLAGRQVKQRRVVSVRGRRDVGGATGVGREVAEGELAAERRLLVAAGGNRRPGTEWQRHNMLLQR